MQNALKMEPGKSSVVVLPAPAFAETAGGIQDTTG
jgi:hypothetical protein